MKIRTSLLPMKKTCNPVSAFRTQVIKETNTKKIKKKRYIPPDGVMTSTIVLKDVYIDLQDVT